MKILFLKEKRSESGIEGIAIYLLNLCKVLNKLKIPYLVIYNCEDLFYHNMLENNISVKILKFPDSSPKNILWRYPNILKARKEIYKIIKEGEFTHVNLHFPSLMNLVSKNWGLPIITHQHAAFLNNDPLKYFYFKDILNPMKMLKSFYRKQVEFNFSKANKIICAGQSAVDSTIGKYCANPSQISVNSYGTLKKDLREVEDVREELGLKLTDKMIISVGRETKAKGVEDFCEVAKLLRSKKYKFFYLGGYREKSYHDELVRKYSNYVQFMGMRTDVERFYKAADLMVFLSHREAGGMVLFESMSYSLPMIVWNTAGVRELVVNDLNGYVCDMGNIQLVSNKVDQILSNSSLHKKLSEGSYNEYLAKYNFEDHTSRLISTFKELQEERY